MASTKRINLAGSAHRREALFRLSTLGLLAMVLVGLAFWSTPAEAGERAGPVWPADMTAVESASVSTGQASGDLSPEFPEDSSGASSFKWNDVDVDWEDGQTVHAGIVPTGESDARQANTPASGLPTISGTAQVGRTLTAALGEKPQFLVSNLGATWA